MTSPRRAMAIVGPPVVWEEANRWCGTGEEDVMDQESIEQDELRAEIESLRATVARLEQIETAAREYRRRFRSGERGVTPARERLFRALDGEA